jgi:hypothetical protein
MASEEEGTETGNKNSAEADDGASADDGDGPSASAIAMGAEDLCCCTATREIGICRGKEGVSLSSLSLSLLLWNTNFEICLLVLSVEVLENLFCRVRNSAVSGFWLQKFLKTDVSFSDASCFFAVSFSAANCFFVDLLANGATAMAVEERGREDEGVTAAAERDVLATCCPLRGRGREGRGGP